MLRERLNLAREVRDYVGKYFSVNYVRRNILKQTEAEIKKMDAEIKKLATTLSQSNPEAMQGLKKIMWDGTDHWDTLLMERAENSGKLVLSDFTKNAIEKFKAK